MLPKMAPRDEPQVTIRNVVLECTVATIQNHQGGMKVTWFWKIQLLNNRLLEVVPALLVTAKQVLPSLKDFNTFRLYALTDATLYGNALQTDLDINDPGDAVAILAAS